MLLDTRLHLGSCNEEKTLTEDNSIELAGWTRREFRGIPASMGALWTRQDEQGWHYGARLDESHANVQGVVHGGVLMTFIDHVMSLLLWELSGRGQVVTVHMDTHFLNALKPPAFVELEPVITREGKNTVFARARVMQGDTPIVEASGVWNIRRPG